MIRLMRREIVKVLSDTWREWFLNGVLASTLVPRHLRWYLLKMVGFPIQRSVIGPKCWFGSRNVFISENVKINRDVTFNASAPVTLKPGVRISQHVVFLTATHEIGDETQRCGPLTPKPITVEEGTWIGFRVTVLAGITIGSGCVIAANSLVTKDCLPDGLYGGVPAKRLRDLPVSENRRKALEAADRASAAASDLLAATPA
jgi:maltose O-acetyltransferase